MPMYYDARSGHFRRMITLPLAQRHELARRADIRAAVAGDMVTLPGMASAYVHRACETDGATLALGCLSCRQLLANVYQLEDHLQLASHMPHVIVRQCGNHGWEPLEP